MTKRACQAANPDNCRWPEHQRQHNASRTLKKAYEDRAAAEKKGLSGVSEYMVAKYRLEEAKEDFNSTDEGIEQLQKIIKKADEESNFKESDHFQALLQKGLLRAAEYEQYDAKTPEELMKKKTESQRIDHSEETRENFRQKAIAKVAAERIVKDAKSLTEDYKEDRDFDNGSLINRFLTPKEYEDLSLDAISLAKKREDEYNVLVLINREEQRKENAWSNGKILPDEVLNDLENNENNRRRALAALEFGYREHEKERRFDDQRMRANELRAAQMKLPPRKKNKTIAEKIQDMFKTPKK